MIESSPSIVRKDAVLWKIIPRRGRRVRFLTCKLSRPPGPSLMFSSSFSSMLSATGLNAEHARR
jgi:hypothetical protein